MWKVVTGFVLGLLLGLVPWVRSPSFAYQAIKTGSVVRLSLYLALGGDPDAQTPVGTLLFAAVDEGVGPSPAVEQMAALIRAGASVDLGRGSDTPLIQAARYCSPRAVELLLKHGANRAARGAMGNTAAQDAALTQPQDEDCLNTEKLLTPT